MNMLTFNFAGLSLQALPSGALWWGAERCLLVADLHLGKSERMARRGGGLLPPYEVTDTLTRLAQDIAETRAREVICLGDSFDDPACIAGLQGADRARMATLQQTCRWHWITGNHDPSMPGQASSAEALRGPLVLRHIAEPGALPRGVSGEISGHYHPKHQIQTRGGRVSCACFFVSPTRVILPAYGTYTGGLLVSDPAFAPFLDPGSFVVHRAARPVAIPISESARDMVRQ